MPVAEVRQSVGSGAPVTPCSSRRRILRLARLVRPVAHQPVERPVGQHAQQLANRAHLPRDHRIAGARGDAIDRAAREVGRLHQEQHPVRVLRGQRGAHEARRQRDHAHAAGTQLHAQALAIADGRRLRRAVRRRARQAADAGHAGHADQRAAPARPHWRDERMKGVRHRQHVGVHHAAERLQVLVVLGQHALGDAGVGDHHVGAAGGRIERARGGDQRIAVGDVAGIGVMAARQRGRQVGQHAVAARHQPQRGAARRVLARQRLADAA